MENLYYVIGYEFIHELSKEELIERLEEEYYGSDLNCLDEIESGGDTNYWGERGVLIIRGNIIVPKPVEITTKYEV